MDAFLRQFPLHMRGMQYSCVRYGSGIESVQVTGQLDRAEANARAKAARYPTAPTYRTHLGNDALKDHGSIGPVLKPIRFMGAAFFVGA